MGLILFIGGVDVSSLDNNSNLASFYSLIGDVLLFIILSRCAMNGI